MGNRTTAASSDCTAIGRNNTPENSPQPSNYVKNKRRLFIIGNGRYSSEKSDAFTVLRNGKVGIDIDHFENTNNSAKLQVNGTIACSGGTVNNYPDYVFEHYYNGFSELNKTYNFKSLATIEKFVKEHRHLPGYKSANEIKNNGGYINITETQLTNMEKIEELYLHTIEQEKRIKQQEKENKALRKEIDELKQLVNRLLEKK